MSVRDNARWKQTVARAKELEASFTHVQKVFHHVDYANGSHISWDTDEFGNYIDGSGHSTDHSYQDGDPRKVTSWARNPFSPSSMKGPFG